MASKRKDRLACALALAALPAGPALAEPRHIDIPSEEAAKSIPEFARQENIQIIAPVSHVPYSELLANVPNARMVPPTTSAS